MRELTREDVDIIARWKALTAYNRMYANLMKQGVAPEVRSDFALAAKEEAWDEAWEAEGLEPPAMPTKVRHR
jgi:hypothetical protein